MNEMYQKRRCKVAKQLKNNSLFVLFSGRAPKSSADAHYPFVVNRNFYYLTGIDRENFIFVMTKQGDQVKSILYIEKPDYDIEKWVGRKLKSEDAKAQSAIDDIRYIENFENDMARLANSGAVKRLYSDFERLSWSEDDGLQHGWSNAFIKRYPFVKVENAQPILIEQRMIKSAEEINNIRQAISYTKKGLEALMHTLKPNAYEYQLDSAFTHSITDQGSKGNSFPTIAASGENAVILHYIENDQPLTDGQMVLMDLGALYNNYASDISRTYPINGKFSKRQRQLYNIVLGAMDAVMAQMKPGTPFATLNDTCKAYLAEQLKGIGLIEKDEELSKYYYHGVSHHLGLDVHDIADRNRALAPGMVLTVEPGLYIAEEGIGIRIEDDVLITKDGYENLSVEIIKKVDDIEAFMAK